MSGFVLIFPTVAAALLLVALEGLQSATSVLSPELPNPAQIRSTLLGMLVATDGVSAPVLSQLLPPVKLH